MAHVDHETTIQKINDMCGMIFSEEEVTTLLSHGERAINGILDASIAHLAPHTTFDDPKSSVLRIWQEFMIGKQTAEPKKPEISEPLYQRAMFLKAILCSKHAPIGLFRRNIFHGARVLDIGGGLGFYSCLFQLFGAKPTLVETPEADPCISDTLKKSIKVITTGFPISVEAGQTWNIVLCFEFLHGRSIDQRMEIINDLIPALLAKDGLLVITEVDPGGRSPYSRLFNTRIKLMTDGVGSAIMQHDVVKMASANFNIAALVSWHSLPYYTVILKKN